MRGALALGLVAVLGATITQTAACNDAAAQGAGPEAASDRAGDQGEAASAAQARQGADLALAYEADASTPQGKRIAALQQVVREAPGDLEAHHALAAALMKRQRETGNASFAIYAQDVVDAAGRIDPRHPHTRLLDAMLLLDRHEFETAAKKAELLAQALPDDPTPRLILGDARLELGQYEDAADAYQEAMNLHPDLRSYNRAAHMRWLYGDFDGAREILDLAIDAGSARDPEGQAWCFADLGAMYLARGDDRRATASIERALSLLPGYVPALVVKARAQALSGDTAAALTTMKEVIERHPSSEDLLRMVEWARAQGDTDAADRWLSMAESLAQDDPRPLAHFLARHDQQPQRALTLARRELTARQNMAALDTEALALLRAGKLTDAAIALERAMSMGTQDGELYLHRGLIQVYGAEPGRATGSLARARELNPKVDPLLVAELEAELAKAGGDR